MENLSETFFQFIYGLRTYKIDREDNIMFFFWIMMHLTVTLFTSVVGKKNHRHSFERLVKHFRLMQISTYAPLLQE